ncbi:hypothetical protein ApAK_03765 [Thermoplasmatales archaeon AK]|nr:hypothetical protein [Thermoplasmatales archaeon AK]
MNKKILALMMVPIILTMSGALAFSAFTGSITTKVSATAGEIQVDQTAEVTGFYTQNTNITLQGGYGAYSNTIYLMDGKLYNTNPNAPHDVLATVPNSGYLQSLVYYVNVSNLAPGNWVTLTFSISVGPGVGVIFSDPAVGSATLHGTDLNLSNVTGAAGGFFTDSGLPHELGIFTSGSELTGVHLVPGTSYNYTYASNDPNVATGPGTVPTAGYAFAITSVSGFGGSVDTSSSGPTYIVSIGLSSLAGNNYEESSVSIPIVIDVTSDA